MSRVIQLLCVGLLSFGAVIATACGGDDDDDPLPTATTDSLQNEQTPTPTGNVGGGQPTPTDAPEDAVPTFEAGSWSEGEAEVRSIGESTRQMTGTLLERSSRSEQGTTRLTYADGLDTINISISTVYQPFAVSVTVDSVRSESVEEPCEVTYIAREEDHLEGTFACEGARINSYNPNVQVSGTVRIEGTFRAIR